MALSTLIDWPCPTCHGPLRCDERSDSYLCFVCLERWPTEELEERFPAIAAAIRARRPAPRPAASFTLPPIPVGFEWVEDL